MNEWTSSDTDITLHTGHLWTTSWMNKWMLAFFDGCINVNHMIRQHCLLERDNWGVCIAQFQHESLFLRDNVGCYGCLTVLNRNEISCIVSYLSTSLLFYCFYCFRFYCFFRIVLRVRCNDKIEIVGLRGCCAVVKGVSIPATVTRETWRPWHVQLPFIPTLSELCTLLDVSQLLRRESCCGGGGRKLPTASISSWDQLTTQMLKADELDVVTRNSLRHVPH